MSFGKRGLVGLVMMLPLLGARAEAYKIHISNLHREVKTNWLKLPESADCTVEWELYQGEPENWEPVATQQLDRFELRCFAQETPETCFESKSVEGNFATIAKVPANRTFGFIVVGLKNGEPVAVSDTAWATTGRVSATQGERRSVWHHYFPLSGRVPMQAVGHAEYFDNSTRAGKAAFHMIWNFFIAGIIVWLFYCIKNLRLGAIFPLESGRGIRWKFAFDSFYEQNKSSQFEQGVVEKWHEVIEKSTEAINTRLHRYQPLTEENMVLASADHWQETGSAQIEAIRNEIDRGHLNRFPAVRIIHAGLEKHELGGYHWMTASEKVDRAIESRAASELENLRRRSLMDWLWNLGTLSPLIGLFGTATGISNAFKNLVSLKANVSQADLVKQLAGGINEALWTTIFGLAVSFFLMMLYFYYHNKLNWIYSKWEELYVRVSEKL